MRLLKSLKLELWVVSCVLLLALAAGVYWLGRQDGIQTAEQRQAALQEKAAEQQRVHEAKAMAEYQSAMAVIRGRWLTHQSQLGSIIAKPAKPCLDDDALDRINGSQP